MELAMPEMSLLERAGQGGCTISFGQSRVGLNLQRGEMISDSAAMHDATLNHDSYALRGEL